jgi:hypothetical protein
MGALSSEPQEDTHKTVPNWTVFNQPEDDNFKGANL